MTPWCCLRPDRNRMYWRLELQSNLYEAQVAVLEEKSATCAQPKCKASTSKLIYGTWKFSSLNFSYQFNTSCDVCG